MSFRFPSEGIIDGQRFDGDIQLHFAELSSQRRTATSNGLILTIPVKADYDAESLENFDNLNMEFWRYEVQKHGTYTPRNFVKKKIIKILP